MKTTTSKYEKALRSEILNYPERQKKLWKRSYRSLDSYLASVQNNREKWKHLLRGSEGINQNITLQIRTIRKDLNKIILTTSHGIRSEALLLLPTKTSKKRMPLVLGLHGMGGSPEMVIGRSDTTPNSYHGYGRFLVEAGFAVLAPGMINNSRDRARINRMALLLGSSVWGVEIQILKRITDFVLKEYPIEKNRVAAWGLSMGGAYTLCWMPLEQRIKAGIVSAWFNSRLRKMVVEDKRYSCFLPTEEEHAFLPGLLTGFSDQDMVSLILPRPLLIQTGKKDDIAWPGFVRQEFEGAKYHFQKLGLQDRLQWHLHAGGHEVKVRSGIEFLKTWL